MILPTALHNLQWGGRTYFFGSNSFRGAFEDELESLVQLGFDQLRVLQEFFGVLSELLLLLFCICTRALALTPCVLAETSYEKAKKNEERTSKVLSIGTRKSLSKPCSNPRRRPDPRVQLRYDGRNLRYNLNATATDSKDRNSLSLKFERLVVACTVAEETFE